MALLLISDLMAAPAGLKYKKRETGKEMGLVGAGKRSQGRSGACGCVDGVGGEGGPWGRNLDNEYGPGREADLDRHCTLH